MPWCLADGGLSGAAQPPNHGPGDRYFMRHLGARFARAASGNIDADPAAMEDLRCDSSLDWTALQAPSRQGTSGPMRHTYEA